jgi:hypothetical protein
MLLPLIVIELVVCLTLMLSGWLLDVARAWFAPTRESSRRLGPYGGVTVRASSGQDRGHRASPGVPRSAGNSARTGSMEVKMRPTEQTAPNRSAPNGNGRTEVVYALGSQVVADPGGSPILDEGYARFSQPRKPGHRWGAGS